MSLFHYYDIDRKNKTMNTNYHSLLTNLEHAERYRYPANATRRSGGEGN